MFEWRSVTVRIRDGLAELLRVHLHERRDCARAKGRALLVCERQAFSVDALADRHLFRLV